MPKICCVLCSRRTNNYKQRTRIGTASVWPMFEVHAERNGLDISQFSFNDQICMKCNATIAHYRMNDRGPNKVKKVMKPIVFEPIIKKDVLRRFKNSTVNVTTSNDSITQDEVLLVNTTEENRAELEEYADNCAGDILSLSITDESQNFSVVTPQSLTLSPELTGNAEQSTTINEVNDDVVFDEIVTNTDCASDILSLSITNESQNAAVTPQSLILSPELTGNAEQSVSINELNDDVVFREIVTDTELDSQSSLNSETETIEHISNNQQSSMISPEASSFFFQGVKSSQFRCFICQSATGRKAIPWPAIQQAWFQQLCYIPKSNRICQEHLTTSNKFNDEAFEMIAALKQDISVNCNELGLWLLGISSLPKPTPYNFEHDGIEAEKYKMLVGITKENFDDLVQYLHGMRNTSTRSVRTALAMFLMCLRNNMKQEILAFNFSTSQQVVSSTIDAVSAALEEYFVPKNLGYYHITREEALEKHSIKLTSTILGQSESRLCLIADCTYNYIEAPSDFELQRKTFSLHKKRNLLKPLYIVLPSGYILEAARPYFTDANNNDAANIRHHYKNSDLLLFLEEDDFFIFDRGFRDVVSETTTNGQSVFMPCLLGGKRTHFTCEEANESRKVTMNRWVVEAVNARIKNVFPFFRHTIEGSYVPKIIRFNRIVCAIINKYFPPLFTDKDFHNVIIEESANLTSTTNEFKEEIERLGIQRMTARWVKATEASVPEFPNLTMDDLKRLTLGSYQIKIAEKYISQHMKGDNQFGIFIHLQNEGIIRAKIQSRFSRSKTHNSWVKYDQNEVGYEAIKGLYCSCKVGERSLGCCSHLTTVVRYLGYDRHQPQKPISHSRMPWDAIDCYEGDYNSSDDEVNEIDL